MEQHERAEFSLAEADIRGELSEELLVVLEPGREHAVVPRVPVHRVFGNGVEHVSQALLILGIEVLRARSGDLGAGGDGQERAALARLQFLAGLVLGEKPARGVEHHVEDDPAQFQDQIVLLEQHERAEFSLAEADIRGELSEELLVVLEPGREHAVVPRVPVHRVFGNGVEHVSQALLILGIEVLRARSGDLGAGGDGQERAALARLQFLAGLVLGEKPARGVEHHVEDDPA